MGDITRNFSLYEFYSIDGGTFSPEVRETVISLAKNLQHLRDYFGKPVTVTSGYRTKDHNEDLIRRGYPASRNSQHLLGRAADIQVDGISTERVYKAIEHLISRGCMQEGGLGWYDTIVHYDIRVDKFNNPIRARWDYRKHK